MSDDEMNRYLSNHTTCCFLNLPLWANFYNYTDLSCSTTTTTITTLDQPTQLDDLNLNPQPG